MSKPTVTLTLQQVAQLLGCPADDLPNLRDAIFSDAAAEAEVLSNALHHGAIDNDLAEARLLSMKIRLEAARDILAELEKAEGKR